VSAELLPWAGLLLLGAVHGINPGMGWLFAVALGLQEGSGRAVWRALLPLAAGHALAIGAAVAVAALLGLVVPPALLRWLVAGALLGVGAWRLVRHRHPRWGSMRVSARDLAIWSFLMATAHGAGLMVLPLALTSRAGGGHGGHRPGVHDAHDAAVGGAHGAGAHGAHDAVADAVLAGSGGGLIDMAGLLATALHTAGYLLVTGVIAVVVYEKVGLRFLRSAWINLDAIWAGALVVTAVLTVLL
jgi:hypothetical protein